MRRQDAITALLSAQSKPKIAVEQTIDRGTRSGLTSAGAPLSRVRDRMTIQAETNPTPAQKPLSERQRLIELYSHSYEADQKREREEREAKEQKRREQRDLEQRAKWKEENDRRELEVSRERTVTTIFENDIKRQVREILSDATAEEITLVLKKIDEADCRGFVPAYQVFLDEIRGEKR